MTKWIVLDGWHDDDRDGPFNEFLESYDGMERDIYELKNCVRRRSLEEMRLRLLIRVTEMSEALENLEGDEIVEETDDDDEETDDKKREG